MLESCPECKLQVSNYAAFCPHCGYIFNPEFKNSPPRKKSNRRRRLPNGFGQITKIKNANLRAPYRAMVTVGKNEDGRPICKLLKPQSYFETYNEAYEALINYNKNPYDLSQTITMNELFEKMIENCDRSKKNKNDMRSTWGYCREIYDKEVRQVRMNDLKLMIDRATVVRKGLEIEATPRTKIRIKSLLNVLYDYARENELVDRNLARDFSLNPTIQKEMHRDRLHHITFTHEELNKLWENINFDGVRLFLINCYTGWRPSELLNLKLEDIDIEERIMIGGLKTEAGKNRIVPIHSGIQQLVIEQMKYAEEQKSEWFIPSRRDPKKQMSYEDYRRIFVVMIKTLDLSEQHKPHDMRKTFVTLAKEYNVDEWAIKRIVGHHISDITESVYTDRKTEWFIEEVEKIKITCQKCDV